MADPAWDQGNYVKPPEYGGRLWRDIMFLAARSPEAYQAQFENPLELLGFSSRKQT
jgi:homoserine acetyltransferase